MGEQLGLSDQFAPEAAGTLMSAFLVNGERVLPSVSDVAEANTGTVVQGWHDQLMHNGDNFNFGAPWYRSGPADRLQRQGRLGRGSARRRR
jgi:hypothetical protein